MKKSVSKLTDAILGGSDVTTTISESKVKIYESSKNEVLQKLQQHLNPSDINSLRVSVEYLADAISNKSVFGAYDPEFTIEPFAFTDCDDTGVKVEYMLTKSHVIPWDEFAAWVRGKNIEPAGDYSTLNTRDSVFDTIEEAQGWVKQLKSLGITISGTDSYWSTEGGDVWYPLDSEDVGLSSTSFEFMDEYECMKGMISLKEIKSPVVLKELTDLAKACVNGDEEESAAIHDYCSEHGLTLEY